MNIEYIVSKSNSNGGPTVLCILLSVIQRQKEIR
jgi:hypothetical protein